LLILITVYILSTLFLSENLVEDPDQPFNPHQDLGKYFEWWQGSRYVPNCHLRQRYPQDIDEDTG
jgi:hypothetical protein